MTSITRPKPPQKIIQSHKNIYFPYFTTDSSQNSLCPPNPHVPS
jgi:hypothetical protein